MSNITYALQAVYISCVGNNDTGRTWFMFRGNDHLGVACSSRPHAAQPAEVGREPRTKGEVLTISHPKITTGLFHEV